MTVEEVMNKVQSGRSAQNFQNTNTMTIKEVMNKVQNGQSAQNFQNVKMGNKATNSGNTSVEDIDLQNANENIDLQDTSESASEVAEDNNTQFQSIANSNFEERRQREISIMKDIVYGKTPMNILKTTSERNDATEITLKTLDGEVDKTKKVAPQRMTAESFIKTVMTIRNLSGQNVMISEDEIKKMGLTLAPYAKPFYDENNNKFYELSVTRRSVNDSAKRIKLYKNKRVSQNVIDKLNAPSTGAKDGFAPDVESALKICDKLSSLTGIALEPSDNANTFMPSTLGKISKKAKDTLSSITLNKWQSKKFVSQSGKLFADIKGMNGTEVLTNYLSSCAMRSFDTNISTFLNVVNSDRGFQSLDAKAKKSQIEDYKQNYELIKYKLHNICTDLIASEMCKMLPDMVAEERLALSEGYLTSAMQRMNDLGKYLQDPYVMKFISKTVTDSVSRYNANFAFSIKQIVDANCNVCGYKNMFKVGNRDKAIFGEYEVPTNGDFKFSSFPTVEATKEMPKSELDNAKETATPTADKAAVIDKLVQAENAAKALAGLVVETTNAKFASSTQENAPTNDSENVVAGAPSVSKEDSAIFSMENKDSSLIFDSHGRVANNKGKTQIVDPKWGYNTESVNLVELAKELNNDKENDVWGYNTESVNLVELAKELNNDKENEEKTPETDRTTVSEVKNEQVSTALTPANTAISPSIVENEQVLDPKLADAMFHNVQREPKERSIYPILTGETNEKDDKNYLDGNVTTVYRNGTKITVVDFPEVERGEISKNTEESKTVDINKPIGKNAVKNLKPAKPAITDMYNSASNEDFGKKSSESMRKDIEKYIIRLTKNALNEKSLADKKRAVEKENARVSTSQKFQAISSSQNAVTTLYNSVHNCKTAQQAHDVIDKAGNSSANAQVIEAVTLKELDKLMTDEIDKALKVYEENKDAHPEWGESKRPASFMNYYHKNIVGAETKYGNDLKKRVKLTCRKMDAAIAADGVLLARGANYRMYDPTTFIVREEKNDIAGLNAYTVHKIVERQNADPKMETLTIYSDVADLVNNAELDEQYKETFATIENLQANDGYIGRAFRGMQKPVVYPKRLEDLRRAKIRDKIKSDI